MRIAGYMVLMLDDLRILLNSQLKIFFSKSYSLELMFLLHENKRHQKGIFEIYETICSPKPKQPSFDNFIQLLVLKNFVYLSTNKDKRKKTIQLRKEWSDLLTALGY